MKKLVTVLSILVSSSALFAAEPVVNGCSALAHQATLSISKLNDASSVSPKTSAVVSPSKDNDEAALYKYTFQAYNVSKVIVGEYTTKVMLVKESGQCVVVSVKIGEE